MKKTCYLFLLIAVFFATNVFASSGENSQHIITVHGTAKLFVPIDQAELRIFAYIQGETAQDLEKKGYQIGLKLKNVFKKFGITGKSIKDSNVGLRADIDYEDKDKIKFKFDMSYTIQFQRLDLIDSFREECIEAGATGFDVAGLINNNRQENKAKVKRLAYQNAKLNAEAIIQGTGLKLGLPLSINGTGSNSNDEDYFSNTEGLGPDPSKVREALLQQEKIYISDEVKVTFDIGL